MAGNGAASAAGETVAGGTAAGKSLAPRPGTGGARAGWSAAPARRGERGPAVAAVLQRAAARLRAAGAETARLDAEVLLMDVFGWSREDLCRNPGAEVGERQRVRFEDRVARRLRAEPVAYLTGSQEFWSLAFRVTPDVLIPRPETEHLVAAVLDFPAVRRGPCRILEIGTGSGAVAVSLAVECPRAEVWATDVSAPALAVARENAARHGVGERIRWRQGDLFAPVQGLAGRFDVVVSNPPYIPTGELPRLPPGVRDWEPRLALDGGADGMDCIRRLVRGGVRHLRAGGLLALEMGAAQGRSVTGLLRAQAELHRVRLRPDYAGLPRVASAERTPAA